MMIWEEFLPQSAAELPTLDIIQQPPRSPDFDGLEPLIQKSSDDLRRISHNLTPLKFERIELLDSLQQLVTTIPNNLTYFDFFDRWKSPEISFRY